jgi:hypothetical protein
MTEDEKKEFEEFLKWKAEKAQQAEETKQTSEPEKVVESTPQQVNVTPENTKSSSDVEKGSSNKGLYIMGAAVAVIILLFIIVGLSGNKKSAQPAEEEEEYVVVDDDSVAVVVADADYTNEPAKAVWDFYIEKDQMTDSKNIWARITSDNYITQEFPYEGQTRATITVRYMKKYGYDVLIQISKGQMNGREYYSTNYVTARFDEGSPKKYYFNESSDGDSKVVFLRKTGDFIKNCKSAKDIKIDLPYIKVADPCLHSMLMNH